MATEIPFSRHTTVRVEASAHLLEIVPRTFRLFYERSYHERDDGGLDIEIELDLYQLPLTRATREVLTFDELKETLRKQGEEADAE